MCPICMDGDAFTSDFTLAAVEILAFSPLFTSGAKTLWRERREKKYSRYDLSSKNGGLQQDGSYGACLHMPTRLAPACDSNSHSSIRNKAKTTPE
jgi:hypothetical protein